MVLGFGSRSSKKKSKDEDHVVRLSPSLPEMKSQGIPWPSDLVDVAAIRQAPVPESPPAQGAAKVSFSSPDRSTIPFHKPFRVTSSKSHSAGDGRQGTIASLYMSSHPPSSFSGQQERAPTSHSHRTLHSHRRSRVAPTFNLMVCFLSHSYVVLSKDHSGRRRTRNGKELSPQIAHRHGGHITDVYFGTADFYG